MIDNLLNSVLKAPIFLGEKKTQIIFFDMNIDAKNRLSKRIGYLVMNEQKILINITNRIYYTVPTK